MERKNKERSFLERGFVLKKDISREKSLEELQKKFSRLKETLSLSQKEAREILIFVVNDAFLSRKLPTELKENVWKVMANICILEGMVGVLKLQAKEGCLTETLLTNIVFQDDTIYLY